MEAIAANILLEGLAVNALAQCETPVTLVTTDSREVCPGCIFCLLYTSDAADE